MWSAKQWQTGSKFMKIVDVTHQQLNQTYGFAHAAIVHCIFVIGDWLHLFFSFSSMIKEAPMNFP